MLAAMWRFILKRHAACAQRCSFRSFLILFFLSFSFFCSMQKRPRCTFFFLFMAAMPRCYSRRGSSAKASVLLNPYAFHSLRCPARCREKAAGRKGKSAQRGARVQARAEQAMTALQRAALLSSRRAPLCATFMPRVRACVVAADARESFAAVILSSGERRA